MSLAVHISDRRTQYYARAGTASIEEVFNKIIPGRGKTHVCGKCVKVSTLRLLMYKFKGIVCTSCGIEAEYFAVEKNNGSSQWHLNLYGVADGIEVLFTKDHIYPKSKGGRTTLSNLQPMCCWCNFKKGDTVVKEDKE